MKPRLSSLFQRRTLREAAFATFSIVPRWIASHLVAIGWIGALTAQPVNVVPSFENRWTISSPSTIAPIGIALFSGEVFPDLSAAPYGGSVVLANWSAGQTFAPGGAEALATQQYPRTPYDIWVDEEFSEAVHRNFNLAISQWGMSADPDNDGIVNWREYQFGTNPKLPNQNPEYGIVPNSEPPTFFLRNRQRLPDSRLAISQRILWSSNLVTGIGSWQELAELPGNHPQASIESSTQGAIRSTMVSIPVEGTESATELFFYTETVLEGEQPPQVSINLSMPPLGGVFIVGNPIMATAIATDAEGSIILLELFFQRVDANGKPTGNSIALGRVHDERMTTPVPTTATGTFIVWARALDDQGLSSVTPALPFRIGLDSDFDGIADLLDPRIHEPNEPPAVLAIDIASSANLHTEGLLTARFTFRDPDGDPVFIRMLLDGLDIIAGGAASPLVWQPPNHAAGLRELSLIAEDRWTALSVPLGRQLYIFRTPPRPN